MPALAKLLKEHRLQSGHAAEENLVFPSSKGRGLDHPTPRAASKRAVEQAGPDRGDRPKVRFHDLRHSFPSRLIASGGNVVFVARQLGHASPDVTLRVYAHLFDAAEHAERASAALEHGFGALLNGNAVETNSGDGPRDGAERTGAEVVFLPSTAAAGD